MEDSSRVDFHIIGMFRGLAHNACVSSADLPRIKGRMFQIYFTNCVDADTAGNVVKKLLDRLLTKREYQNRLHEHSGNESLADPNKPKDEIINDYEDPAVNALDDIVNDANRVATSSLQERDADTLTIATSTVPDPPTDADTAEIDKGASSSLGFARKPWLRLAVLKKNVRVPDIEVLYSR
ncbi:hypothetical protein CHS0354_037405 [Potamilus streckersoni]|uniref:Uncharacterized protein n=1 Tax=Potamilus streckersoni TaxID=2493646 RepID=A0AAE0RRW7_9BIVA|nr:hypothetical protein CHS0354_037405 [Potamilus streckersoni]